MNKRSLVFFCLFALLAAPLRSETMIAFTSDRKIHYFQSTSPGTYTKTVDIAGLGFGDIMLNAATTPTGQLFLLTRAGSTMTIRIIDPQTGAIVQEIATNPPYPAAATGFGMDVTPWAMNQVDIVHDVDEIQSLATNGGTAPIAISYDNTAADGDPVDVHSGANPAVVALAHTNNFPTAESSVLYGIDSTQNTLVLLERFAGKVNTIGSLGTDTGARASLEISGTSGNAYAALSTGNESFLYKVNLSTGAATQVGRIGPAVPPSGVVVLSICALPTTRVANISTRGRVGSGDDVMIAGFIAQGGADTRRLLIRGIGPSLGNFGVPNPLADPVLRIVDSNGVEVATNDNWKSTQQNAIALTGLAPSNDLEAAYLGQFAAGQYSAVLSGKDGGTGVGLVEVYQFTP